MNNLFGDEEWKTLCNKEGICREEQIIELIEKKLKLFTKYVTKFRFCFEDMNRTYYYIFHLTNHEKGCNIFKGCVKKHCGDFEFKGKFHNQTKLGQFIGDDQRLIEEKLIKNYLGKEKLFIEIFREQIDKIKGTEGDLKRAIISLENKQKLKVERVNRKNSKKETKSAIHNEDKIFF